MENSYEHKTNSSKNRFKNIVRDYSLEDVRKLSGSVQIEYTLARNGANTLWHLLQTEDYVPTLGAMTGNQALQQIRAGLKSIYLSGWQVAADSNTAGAMYPDQSIYPANSGPELARRINNTLLRADEVDVLENGGATKNWMAPIVADCEAGFGGALNAYEITKSSVARADAIKREAMALKRNPELIQLRLAEKWDGQLPQFSGGSAVPLLNIDSLSKTSRK